MRKYHFIFIVAVLLFALSSSCFAAVNNKYFRADKQYFDVETGQYVISGNIVIHLSNGFIAGDKARVKLSTLEFWGTGGWTLKQDDVTFKGESAYVVFGKNSAMIEGAPTSNVPTFRLQPTALIITGRQKSLSSKAT
jgi:lipopolysaccharide export system protein LptA